ANFPEVPIEPVEGLGYWSSGFSKGPKKLSCASRFVRRIDERPDNMNMQNQNEYLLLFRGNAWLKALSAEQLQKVVSDWAAWFERLTREGKCEGGRPLEDEGCLVSGRHGRIVTDGPFVESKEAIGGYFHLRVADKSEAVAIAQGCPGLEYGCVVEVRPMAETCTERARRL